jgi:hypothetical protein
MLEFIQPQQQWSKFRIRSRQGARCKLAGCGVTGLESFGGL